MYGSNKHFVSIALFLVFVYFLHSVFFPNNTRSPQSSDYRSHNNKIILCIVLWPASYNISWCFKTSNVMRQAVMESIVGVYNLLVYPGNPLALLMTNQYCIYKVTSFLFSLKSRRDFICLVLSHFTNGLKDGVYYVWIQFLWI